MGSSVADLLLLGLFGNLLIGGADKLNRLDAVGCGNARHYTPAGQPETSKLKRVC